MNLKRYQFEIDHIINELRNLENGIFYEEGCTKHPGTASAKTIATNLKQDFITLMGKIIKEEPGTLEIIDKAIGEDS
ncbi:hypothetical protein [Clostridium tyrobutyricum]|uniref:hypothetical protein n=1 Tax=Clostridium tyrobutyricum TaxID=1519 RepID=UPI00057D2B05|nr:hypothetical protein [Clostridium tyrobutyricum]